MAKMHFLLNWSHCVKSYGHFCQILALLTIPAHQIWSCHMIQDAHFENLLFCSDSTFIIRKSHKISSGKALYFRSYQQKPQWKTPLLPPPPPPSAFRVKRVYLFLTLMVYGFKVTSHYFRQYHQVIFKYYRLK